MVNHWLIMAGWWLSHQPLWKMMDWKSVGMMTSIPNCFWKVIKIPWFQTTNQYLYIMPNKMYTRKKWTLPLCRELTIGCASSCNLRRLDLRNFGALLRKTPVNHGELLPRELDPYFWLNVPCHLYFFFWFDQLLGFWCFNRHFAEAKQNPSFFCQIHC